MRRIRLRRPSPALVVACVALGVALGGTSYAAIVLPANSVGTAQLRYASVTSPKVRDRSLALADLQPAAREALEGISGLEIVDAASKNDSDNFKSAVAACPDGKKVIGGGAGIGGPADDVALVTSEPSSDTEWIALAAEVNPTTQAWVVVAKAICAVAS